MVMEFLDIRAFVKMGVGALTDQETINALAPMG